MPAAAQSLPGYMNRGSENNLFVATGDGIRAQDVIPLGQSGLVSPGGEASPHTTDQLKMYTDFRYKSVPFRIEEVKAAAAAVKTLRMPR